MEESQAALTEDRKTDDLLNSVKIPVGTNFNAQMTQNIGSLENYGMEFSINAKPIVTKDFTWDLSYNVTPPGCACGRRRCFWPLG